MRWTCEKCGKSANIPADAAGNVRCSCGNSVISSRQQSGLGDYTESLLKSIGVTQDRYKAAKELFGLAPTCNCDKRKAWLNRVGEWWLGS